MNLMCFDRDEWAGRMHRIETHAASFVTYEGRLTQDSRTLLQGLRDYEFLAAEIEAMIVQAQVLVEQEDGNPEWEDLLVEAEDLSFQVQEQIGFAGPEIQALPEPDFLALLETEPELERYRLYLQRLRSEAEEQEREEVIQRLENVGRQFERAYRSLLLSSLEFPAVSDEEGQPVQVTLNNFRDLLRDADCRAFRKRVYEAVYRTLGSIRQTCMDLYQGYVQKELEVADLCGYPSSLDRVLSRDQLDPELVDSWRQTVHDHLPLLHRYMRLKRDTLRLPELQPYDLYRTCCPGALPTYDFEEAKALLLDAVEPLGSDYQQKMQTAFAHVINRPHHVTPYTINCFLHHPVVMMRYEGSLHELFILAHEMGHALQMQEANQAQTYVNATAPLLPSETAALVHELLLIDELLERATPETQLPLLEHLLEKCRHLLFRTTMLSEFEIQSHQQVQEQGRLSVRFTELLARYYGEAVVVDERIGDDWIRVPHLYDAFYTCSYPLAFAIAVEVRNKLKQSDGPELYFRFLKEGNSRGREEIFNGLGINNDNSGLFQGAFTYFTSLLNVWEARLKEE